MPRKPKKITKKKLTLSAEEKKKRRDERIFKSNINTVFKNAGFHQIPCRDKEFDFKGQKAEFDGLFLHENILVISEDTVSGTSNSINDHLRKKAVIYKHILDNGEEFIDFLPSVFPAFGDYREQNNKYETPHYKIIFVYCSRIDFEDSYKKYFRDYIRFLDYPFLRYFLKIAKAINLSSKYEFFKFLGLNLSDIGITSNQNAKIFDGMLLPESPSGFSKDYKIVTFYIDPQSLLELSYVLRKDGGWRDEDALYQRLVMAGKIKLMRKYLFEHKRVFINNIIVTLPSTTKLLNNENETIKSKEIDKTKAQLIKVNIPREFNSIGIIDWQHRIFSYHEGRDQYEKHIAALREKQNLLVTGIIYPASYPVEDKPVFESKIFLEINDKQSRVKGDLKQAIEAIVNPFEAIAISRAVITRLGTKGPLANILELHFFDVGKVKTSSIVSYGLRHIVKLKGQDSLFDKWPNENKLDLANPDKRSKQLLKEYIEFCFVQIRDVFVAYKIVMSKRGLFTLDQKISRALSSTAINGVIFCIRRMIEDDNLGNEKSYLEGFENLKIDYSKIGFNYRSSHWKDLGDAIYEQCFKK